MTEDEQETKAKEEAARVQEESRKQEEQTTNANEAAERLEKANDAQERLNKANEATLARIEEQKAKDVLAGKANGNTGTKEETPHEYRLRVDKELSQGTFDDRR